MSAETTADTRKAEIEQAQEQARNKFPPEMFRAFYPDRRTVHGATLHAPTLMHVVLMNQLGCYGPMDEEKALIAAYVLAHPSTSLGLEVVDTEKFVVWTSKHGGNLAELKAAVLDLLDTAIKSAVVDESKQDRIQVLPTGYGWPLEVAEKMVAEYGWTFDEVKHMPIGTLFALLASMAKRNGKEQGPDYYARQFLPGVIQAIRQEG